MTVFALALLAAVATVLFVPLRVELQWDSTPESVKPRVRVRMRWLFFVWRSGKPTRKRPERARRPRSRTSRAGPSRRRRVLAALKAPGFLPRLGQLAVDLWRALAPRAVDGWVRVGFGDPVSTGALFGAAHAAAGLVQALGWMVRLEPEFAGPTFDGLVRAEWKLRPVTILWPVGTFVASRATWRAVVAAVRRR